MVLKYLIHVFQTLETIVLPQILYTLSSVHSYELMTMLYIPHILACIVSVVWSMRHLASLTDCGIDFELLCDDVSMFSYRYQQASTFPGMNDQHNIEFLSLSPSWIIWGKSSQLA